MAKVIVIMAIVTLLFSFIFFGFDNKSNSNQGNISNNILEP